jgi:hypothetical protein
MTESADSTVVINGHKYIEIESGVYLPDLNWLAPLVVQAFLLQSCILKEVGNPPLPELENDYKRLIDDIAKRLLLLPYAAIKIAKQLTPASIWIDIAKAIDAHNK